MSIHELNAVVMEIAEIAGDLQQRAFDYDVVWPRYRDDAASSNTRLAVLARQLVCADHPPQ